jgi:hypothetical protein
LFSDSVFSFSSGIVFNAPDGANVGARLGARLGALERLGALDARLDALERLGALDARLDALVRGAGAGALPRGAFVPEQYFVVISLTFSKRRVTASL